MVDYPVRRHLWNFSVTSTICADLPQTTAALTGPLSACCRPCSECVENDDTNLGVVTDHVIE
jgi:hypothetical protein